jgi:hypothetical protein
MEQIPLIVKISIDDYKITECNFDNVKDLIATIEKEYGGNHTLSINLTINF